MLVVTAVVTPAKNLLLSSDPPVYQKIEETFEENLKVGGPYMIMIPMCCRFLIVCAPLGCRAQGPPSDGFLRTQPCKSYSLQVSIGWCAESVCRP